MASVNSVTFYDSDLVTPLGEISKEDGTHIELFAAAAASAKTRVELGEVQDLYEDLGRLKERYDATGRTQIAQHGDEGADADVERVKIVALAAPDAPVVRIKDRNVSAAQVEVEFPLSGLDDFKAGLVLLGVAVAPAP